MVVLETERLILRSVAEQDAAVMLDYRSNEVCAKYQHGQAKEPDAINRLIERRKNDTVSVEHPFMLAAALKQSNLMIGEIVVMPESGTITMGYTFHYNYHRRGYAYEALAALTSLLHERYPLWSFICYTEPENAASIALLQKLGYHDMGYLPDRKARAFGKWTTPTAEADTAELKESSPE